MLLFFSRIGNIAAISTSSGAVFIWDVLANQLTHISIPKSMGLPRRMVFSPDGRVLSINSNSGKISFWSVDTGVEIEARQFLDRQAFDSLCFTKDGSLITAKQCNREVELWKEPQIRAGDLSFNRRTIIAHSCLELVGEKLVEEPPGNPTHLWLIIKDGAGAPLLLECGDWNQVACTSPDGRLLAFGDEDGTVRFWNIKTLERMKSVNIARSAIKFLCFSPNSRFLAIGSADGTVRMWDVLGLRTRLIGVHHKRVRSLDYNPCRGILASGSDDGFVRIWRSQKNGKFIRTELLEGNGQPITTVRFSSSGSVLAGGSNDGRVWLWNLLTGKLIGSPFIGCMHSIVTLRISPDGNLLACGTDDGIIHMWHLASDNPTGKVVQLWHVVDAKDGDIDPAPYIRKSVLAISFSPDGTLIASGDECGSIRFRNALNGSRVDFIPRENSTGTVLALSFSPDGCILASSESDGTVHLWDIVNRIELRSLEMQNAAANTLCFSPSGRLLAMGTSDGAIKLWDFESKDGGVVSLDERKGAIWSICFNSSETTLFCAYDSNEVLAWYVGYIKTSSMPHAEIYTDVITPLLGIDLTNNDFSHARIEGESRKTLWQNGVTL